MSFLDETGLAYFYSRLKEKFIRSVTAGNDILTPDASGNVTVTNVATANNLTSPDAQTSYGTFVYRTSGGSANLTSGPAELMYVDGNMEIVGRVTEDFKITAPEGLIVTYNAEVWRLVIDATGVYYFRYVSPSSSQPTSAWTAAGTWSLDGTTGDVILSDYGLSVQGIINPAISIETSGIGVTSATVVPSTFITAMKEDGSYLFMYSTTENSWTYNGESVSLIDYGISAGGTPEDLDTITVTLTVGTGNCTVAVDYTAPERGIIYIPQPTGFSATGFNQFNKNDSNSYINNATISNGTIASGEHIVAFCRAKGGVNNGYVAYSSGGYIIGIGWCADVPETGSEIVTDDAAVTSTLASIPFDDDGYVVIEVTSIEDLCVHPKWSGGKDTEYAEYVEPSTIEFPTHAAPPDPEYPDIPGPELPLHIYGMPRVGSVPDTLDLDAGIYFQRIGRLINTPANMSVVIGLNVDYEYDDSWIYYVLPTPIAYDVIISPDYTVEDYGTEEFLGTDIAATAQTLYSQNLRDKLRTDVLTISTQTPALSTSEVNQVASNLKSTYHVTATLNAATITVNNANILASMRVINAVFSNPAALASDVSWTTANGSIKFTQTLVSGSTTTIDCDLVVFRN